MPTARRSVPAPGAHAAARLADLEDALRAAAEFDTYDTTLGEMARAIAVRWVRSPAAEIAHSLPTTIHALQEAHADFGAPTPRALIEAAIDSLDAFQAESNLDLPALHAVNAARSLLRDHARRLADRD